MSKKCIGELDCIMCGYCCGYRRDSFFGGCSYSKDEVVPEGIIVIEEEDGFRIPVNDDDVCIYLDTMDNGFAICTIQGKKPNMCKLYYCMIETKIKGLNKISDFLVEKCVERDSSALRQLLKEE